MPMTLTQRPALVAAICLLSFTAHARADDLKTVTVPAGNLANALESLGKQFGVDVIYPSEQVRGLKTHGLSGTLDVEAAFKKLLEGTPLILKKDSGAMLITLPKTSSPLRGAERIPQPSNSSNPSPETGEGGTTKRGLRVAQASDSERNENNRDPDKPSSSSEELEEFDMKGMPEILVKGKKGQFSLNTDIRRSRDDIQPYVIFERASIENSAATNLEDFLKTRLTMNSTGTSFSQTTGTFGASSSVNLRGLGSAQTLILIDGRRLVSRLQASSAPDQADINGIPLAAIERVEVLPTTASGIYGGSATGGVINIVLRRDYSGAELKTTYINTFSSDASAVQADLGAGFNLEGGRTNVLLAATWSERNRLTVRDRDFLVEGRARILANNPGFFFNAASPPLGSTPNIRSVNGSPLFGPGTSNITFVPEGYAGGGGLTPLRANAGQYNLTPADTANLINGARRNLVNNPDIYSVSLAARRQFSTRLQAFLELANSVNEGHFLSSNLGTTYVVNATAPNNPFGQAIRVTLPIRDGDEEYVVPNEHRRVVAGIIAQLPWKNWQGTADYSWQQGIAKWKSAPWFAGTEAAAIAAGSIDVLRDLSRFPADFSPHLVTLTFNPRRSDFHNVALRLAGPVGRLPAGAPSLSTLIEYRDERFGDSNQLSHTAQGTPYLPFLFYAPTRSQSLLSGYVETKLPLISPAQRWPLIREIELQVAARYDDYQVNGATGFFLTTGSTPLVRLSNQDSSVNPTLGLRVKAMEDVVFRASYGTGFLPPNVGQLTPNEPFTSTGMPDPRRGNTPTPTNVVVTGGGNPNLEPEDSQSWSAGVIFTPRRAPGLRVSLDWTRIEKTDNITTNPGSPLIIENEAFFPGRVTRGANLPGDLPGWAGPIIALDLTSVNLATAEVEAWDAALDYTWQSSSFGELTSYAVATWQTHYLTRVAPTASLVENVGITTANPLKFKANGGLTWKYRNWTAGWATQHFDSYQVAANPTTTGATTVANQGALRVKAQTYHDVHVSYRSLDAASGSRRQRLANTEVRLGVRNVFNKEPPFDATGDFYSRYGDPRLAVYELSVKKQF